MVLPLVLLSILLTDADGAGTGVERPFGLSERPQSAPYLGLPRSAAGAMPRLLSQTGVFREMRSLSPSDGLIPYELIVPFWSDGASKRRWIAVPNTPHARFERIRFSTTGAWTFPAGTVFVKHFELGPARA